MISRTDIFSTESNPACSRLSFIDRFSAVFSQTDIGFPVSKELRVGLEQESLYIQHLQQQQQDHRGPDFLP